MKAFIKISLLFIFYSMFSLHGIAQTKLDYKISAEQELKTEIAKLWVDNAIYTRQSILCLTDRLPGAQETIYRLMLNQEQMGEVFSKYYGRKAGDEFCQLISSNTALVIRNIRSKNDQSTEELIKTQKRMQAHFSETVDFLVSINSFYSKEELASEINLLVDLMNKQIDYRMRGLYSSDIENFDRIISESIIFSNVIAEGIIKKYPKMFEEK